MTPSRMGMTPETSVVQASAVTVETVAMAPPTNKTVVLAGNPNVGKSLFFNAYTGMYVNVSNFPGTTVDVPRGKMLNPPFTNVSDVQLKDTPGVYGISNFSEEETVAGKTILAADVVINVVSAISLERDLFLTQQLIDYGVPMIIAVNQMDEAKSRKLEIDLVALEKLLGVPVYPTVAVTAEGLDAVKKNLIHARVGHRTPDAPAAEQLKTLEADMGERILLYGHRRHHVNAIAKSVVCDCSKPETLSKLVSQRIGNAMLHPVTGLLSMAFVLYLLYQVVGVWVAGDLVGFLEGKIMLGHDPQFFVGIIPLITHALEPMFPVGTFMHTVLIGEFGVLTMSIDYIFGVLFPLVLGFYVYISLLEDCGYLPRVAVLSDGLLTRMGLNGRAVIPLILGFGCVTMATVSTRVLTSQRERTIASTILAITIPCSAQLAVITALMASVGGLKGWAAFVGILFIVLVTLGTILNKIIPGRSTSLVMDLPPMRMPQLKNIAKKSWVRTRVFLFEAAPLFMLGSFIVAVMQATGLLDLAIHALSPVTEKLLLLPGITAKAFIMGMVRRDFGAAGLYYMKNQINPRQILTALIVITLFVPCIASATVFWKERGIKEAAMILFGSWFLAFAIGAIVARVFLWIPIL